VGSLGVRGARLSLRQRSGLKAVYIAPMKALAQEVVSTFGQRLAPLQVTRRDEG
jgi:replicative superfamily II helicase